MKLLLCLLGISVAFFNRVEARLEGEGILGGTDAAEGQFPYQISLVRGYESVCGGSILSDHFVMTSAHCVVDQNNFFWNGPLKVIAGTTNLKSNPSSWVIIDVVQIFVPTEFDARQETSYSRATGDIAILRLSRNLNIKGNPNLGRVKMPWSGDTYEGKFAIVSGFGWNQVDVGTNVGTGGFEEFQGRSYGMMRFAWAKVLSYDQCQNIFGATLPIRKSHLCAAVVQRYEEWSEGVCSGDSGGPLVYEGVQIGVVSISPLACDENHLPAVYTRVSDYADFIRKVVKGKIDKSIRYILL